jgi:hypothetical protein
MNATQRQRIIDAHLRDLEQHRRDERLRVFESIKVAHARLLETLEDEQSDGYDGWLSEQDRYTPEDKDTPRPTP